MKGLDTFIPPASKEVVLSALASGNTGAAMQEIKAITEQVKPGPLRVTITHEPFMPWLKLEYDGQTEELDHLQCLEWFRLRGANDMEEVNKVINQAINFGQGFKGMAYSMDGAAAVHVNHPGVTVVIRQPKRPGVPPGQQERYLPKL